MSNQIITLNQAEEVLRESQAVQLSPSHVEYVEGKQLLDVCGFSYIEATKDGRQKSQMKKVLDRQIKRHNLVENVDYAVGKVATTDGRQENQYRFTLNAANHILLAAMTKQGKAARQQAIDLAVAVQSNPVCIGSSKHAEAYIGVAKHRAGLVGEKRANWKVAFIQDITENGAIKATESFMKSTDGKACNQLMKEQRAALLLDAENVVKAEQNNYGLSSMRSKTFNPSKYSEFDTAALMLADRRARVLARRVTELTK